MNHTSKTQDDVSEFGRMVEFRSGASVWGGRERFAARHRDHVIRTMIMIAVDDSDGHALTIVLTP
jgi:hypothetical protein